jgi:hypothetical protein
MTGDGVGDGDGDGEFPPEFPVGFGLRFPGLLPGLFPAEIGLGVLGVFGFPLVLGELGGVGVLGGLLLVVVSTGRYA